MAVTEDYASAYMCPIMSRGAGEDVVWCVGSECMAWESIWVEGGEPAGICKLINPRVAVTRDD